MAARVAIAELMDSSGVKFGTSGARGLVSALTDRVAYAYCSAFLGYLERSGKLSPRSRVALGGDLRSSTERILRAVVAAVDVPVTLKIRTGWNRENLNGVRIARIAEEAGVRALAVHGRTRDMLYGGDAEYETIAAIKQAVRIPVIANGDVTSPQKARAVLAATGADALMIGRAAQGRPWIFREIAHFLATGEAAPPLTVAAVRDTLLEHVCALHDFYGETAGVRIARKHLAWYAKDRPENAAFRAVVNRAETAEEQLRLTRDYFAALSRDTAVPALVAAVIDVLAVALAAAEP